ncbi:hypothetical protein MmiHf6_14840 [Methanimicrococcus hongohii]|uniref:Uncharacterized protein n=1 Tax=Methanimicrococcus hongohii TaxID=3028295 RepID=A0AA96ZT52_9EURY|nr:hypothetical protein [Methanimicrococcus sp. Hf6]WNY24155.1 hypothetical protein MmiHf6_14840 [Methanimicrococcus sp. Hf6]
MKQNLFKSMSVLFVMLMLSMVFVPIVSAQADQKIQEDAKLMQDVLDQKFSDIQSKYTVSQIAYSETDLNDLENLVLLLLEEQGVQIKNLNLNDLEKYGSMDDIILAGSILFETEDNIVHTVDLFTHTDLSNGSIEMISKDQNTIKLR